MNNSLAYFLVNLTIGFHYGIYSTKTLHLHLDTFTFKNLLNGLYVAKKDGLCYAYLKSLYFIKEHLKNSSAKHSINIFLNKYSNVLLAEKKKLIRLMKTISYIQNHLAGLPVFCIKTIREIPYCPPDIDLFVPRNCVQKVIETLVKHGFKVRKYSGAEVRLFRNGFNRVDIYSSLTYMNIKFKDVEELIVKHSHPIKLDNIEIYVPSEFVCLVINALHGMLGHNALFLIDLIDTLIILKNLSRDTGHIAIFKKLQPHTLAILLDFIKCCLSAKMHALKAREFIIPSPIKSNNFLKTDLNIKYKILYIFHFIQSCIIFSSYVNFIKNLPDRIKTPIQCVLFLERVISGDTHGF